MAVVQASQGEQGRAESGRPAPQGSSRPKPGPAPPRGRGYFAGLPTFMKGTGAPA